MFQQVAYVGAEDSVEMDNTLEDGKREQSKSLVEAGPRGEGQPGVRGAGEGEGRKDSKMQVAGKSLGVAVGPRLLQYQVGMDSVRGLVYREC